MTIKEKVETEFDVKGTQRYTGAMGVLANSAKGAGSVLSRVLNVVNPLNLALSGLAAGGALAGIAHVASEFEDVQIRMAGTLQALSFVDDFESGMSNASELVRRIHADAALLPGTASDYVAVFTQALPQISQSMDGNLNDMTTWANRFTAIATSLGVESAQAGRDLQRMLQAGQGRAGAMVMTFNRMLPFLQGIEGQASLTASSFNTMSQPERWRLLETAMSGLNDQLGAAAGSFSAIVGASQTTFENMLRLSTGPAFDAMKSAMQRVNAVFMDSNGEATEFGQTIISIGTMISEGIGAALEGIASLVEQIAAGWDGFMGGVMDSPVMATMANLVDSIGGLSLGGGAGLAGGAAAAMTLSGPLAPAMAAIIALGAGFANFLTHTDAVSATLGFMGEIFANFATIMTPLVGFINVFSQILGDIVAGILPGLMEGYAALSGVIFPLVGGLIGLATSVYESLQPALAELWVGVGRVIAAFYTLQAHFLRPFALEGLKIALFLATVFKPQIEATVTALSFLVNGIASLLEWLADVTGQVVDAMISEADARADTPDWYNTARAAILGLASASEEAAAAQGGATGAAAPRAPRTPSGRGGGRVVQDFRYSRFEIEQSFEEGFDPDRIAVAFAQDLGTLGENRLQSGFEPGGVR